MAVRAHQAELGRPHLVLPHVGGDDGVALGERVQPVEDVLREAHEYDAGPCVVVAEVVKEDNVFPMIPAGAAVSEMIIEPPKHKLAKPEGST